MRTGVSDVCRVFAERRKSAAGWPIISNVTSSGPHKRTATLAGSVGVAAAALVLGLAAPGAAFGHGATVRHSTATSKVTQELRAASSEIKVARTDAKKDPKAAQKALRAAISDSVSAANAAVATLPSSERALAASVVDGLERQCEALVPKITTMLASGSISQSKLTSELNTLDSLISKLASGNLSSILDSSNGLSSILGSSGLSSILGSLGL